VNENSHSLSLIGHRTQGYEAWKNLENLDYRQHDTYYQYLLI